MIELKPTHLVAIGSLALACAGPSTPHEITEVAVSRAEFAPAPAEPAAKNARAEASLKKLGKRGRAAGSLELVQRDGWVTLSGQFQGLPVGEHGIQIHSEGSCDGRGAKKSGEDYNPTNTRHGPPASARRHVGDLGNIAVDRNGRAVFQMKTNSLTVTKDGPSSVLGRSVVITEHPDDGHSQPDGNAGPAIACGLIR